MAEFTEGMNLTEVRQLATDLGQAAAQVEAALKQIDARVLSTSWIGKDSAEFKNRWWPAHRTRLHKLTDDLRGYARSTANNADDQQRASDSRPGAGIDQRGGPGGFFRQLPVEVGSGHASAGDLMRSVSQQDPSTIRILRTVGPDGKPAYIVVIPGIVTFLPSADGGLASDMSDAVFEKFGTRGVYQAGIAKAMRDAGISATDPVTLVGHSNGGIVAMNMANNGGWNITGVVTGGSGVPEKLLGTPSNVTVLQLENARDLVNRGIRSADRGLLDPAEHLGQLKAALVDNQAHHSFMAPFTPDRSRPNWWEQGSGHTEKMYGDELDRVFRSPTGDLGPVVDRLKPAFDREIVSEVDYQIYDKPQ